MHTNRKEQQKAPVVIQILPTDDFGTRRRVMINLPIDFDFNDQNSKNAFYHSWNKFHNLPKGNAFYEAVKAVQCKEDGIFLHEMVLACRKGETFVSVIGETNSRVDHLICKMNQIFGNDVEFDTRSIR